MKPVSASDDEWAFSDDGSLSIAGSTPPNPSITAAEDQEMSESEDGWTAPDGSEDWEIDDEMEAADDDDGCFFSEIAPSDAPSARFEAKERELKGKDAPKKSIVYDDFEDDIPDIGIYCGPWRFLVHEEYMKRGSKLFRIVQKKGPSLPDERARYDIKGLDSTAFELLLHYIYTHEYSKRWLDDEFRIENAWEEESVYGAAYAHTPHIYFLKESLTFLQPPPSSSTAPTQADLMTDNDDAKSDASSTHTIRLASTLTSKRITPAWLNVLVYHQACRYKVLGLKEECIHRFIHHAGSEQLSSRLAFNEAFTSIFETEKDPLHRELREAVIKLCTKCTIEVMTSQTNKAAIQELAWLLQRSTKYMRHENRNFARTNGKVVPARGKEWEDDIHQQYSLALAIGISQDTFAPTTNKGGDTWKDPHSDDEDEKMKPYEVDASQPWNNNLQGEVSWFAEMHAEQPREHEKKWGRSSSQVPFTTLFARSAEQDGIEMQRAMEEIKKELEDGPIETRIDRYIDFLRTHDTPDLNIAKEEAVPLTYFGGHTNSEGSSQQQTPEKAKSFFTEAHSRSQNAGIFLTPAQQQASQTTLVNNGSLFDLELEGDGHSLHGLGDIPGSLPKKAEESCKNIPKDEKYIKEEKLE